MLNKVVVLLVSVLFASATWAETPESIRRGYNSMNGIPYNFCSWLVVTGPEAAKQNITDQATSAYKEPDPELLANVEGKVFIELRTVKERGSCSTRTMTEVIFVDKSSDKPILRLELQSKEFAMSNGFGATWEAHDGIAVIDAAEFRSTLAEGKYHVVVVYQDGGTDRIGQGVGGTVWSGKETSKVR